jgi:hypothetical protein
MVPVNLRPLDEPLPPELGNRFTLVLLRLPATISDPAARLAETARRMDRIKDSPEVALTFALINALGLLPHQLGRAAVDFFDAGAVPDPQVLVDAFEAELAGLHRAVPSRSGRT